MEEPFWFPTIAQVFFRAVQPALSRSECLKMSLKRNEIEYPPRTYKTVKQLALPENKSISLADIDSLNVVHEKVHASVEGSKVSWKIHFSFSLRKLNFICEAILFLIFKSKSSLKNHQLLKFFFSDILK